MRAYYMTAPQVVFKLQLVQVPSTSFSTITWIEN